MLDPLDWRGNELLREAPETNAAGTATDTPALLQPKATLRERVAAVLRQEHRRWFTLLGVVEFLALTALAALAPGFAETPVPSHPFGAVLFAALLSVNLLVLGLYQRHQREISSTRATVLVRIALAAAIAAPELLVLDALFPTAQLVAGPLTWTLPLAGLFLVASRFVFARVLRAAGIKRRVLFLGAGSRAALALGRMRREQDRRGVDVVGFVPLKGETVAVDQARLRLPLADLVRHALASRIDEIVIAADDRRGALPMQALLRCRELGIGVIEVEAFCERELERVSLELVQPSWFVFADLRDAALLRRISKRGFDLVVASMLLLLTAPLMGLVALAILIESRWRGPVLYVQERVGLNDRPFALYKFRSMRTDAEMDGVARFASADDARITRVGRVIRKTRLDELPQLWNVLRGEMSIVGPRPERPPFVERFKHNVPYYSLRHCVSPGLTGWAQLRFPYGASEADAVEKLRYDLYYVKNHGLVFDLMVLLQTVEVVLFGRGAR